MQLKQNRTGMVVIDAITLEVEARGAEVQNYLQIHKDCLGYMRQCLKKGKKINQFIGKKKKSQL